MDAIFDHWSTLKKNSKKSQSKNYLLKMNCSTLVFQIFIGFFNQSDALTKNNDKPERLFCDWFKLSQIA